MPKKKRTIKSRKKRFVRTGFFFIYNSDQIRCAALIIKLLFGCTGDVGLSTR